MKTQLLSALLLSLSAAPTVHSLVFHPLLFGTNPGAKSLLCGGITSSSLKTRNRNTLCTLHFLFVSDLKDKGMQRKEYVEEDFVFS